MEVVLLAIIFIAVAFLALGFNIFFRHGRKFPETEIGRNSSMRKLGIACPKCDERKEWDQNKSMKKQRINPSELKIDIDSLS